MKIKKRTLIVLSTVLLTLLCALIIILIYYEIRLTENSVRIINAEASIFNQEIGPLPEGIEFITQEDFLLAMEDEFREMTDEEFRESIEREFIPRPPAIRENITWDDLDRLLNYESDDSIYRRDDISDRIYNVLFMGDDARIDQDRGRTDTIILISFNRDTRVISLTSFMRDMLVPNNLNSDFWNRINFIYSVGGPGRTINLINSIFSLDIQRYAVVRFSGVFALVDALGGLDLDLTADEAALLTRIFPDFDSLSEGYNLLNGRQILAYSRIRILDNDLVRTQRQRYVLMSLLYKILDTRNIGEVFTIANFMLDHVETNVSLTELIPLGLELFAGSRPQVEELRIPIDDSFNHGIFHGAYILTVDFEDNIRALHEFIYGTAEDVNIPVLIIPEMDRIELEPIEEQGDEVEGEINVGFKVIIEND